jgi:tryptophan 6-halogenase
MVKNIVIVGGGTAGWMSACYLKATFGASVSVTLVESKQIPAIGVGEATFSTVRHFFRYLGLQEQEWMPQCSATYKLAIRFEDWREPGHVFYHPFERARIVEGFPVTDWWLHRSPSERFDLDCFVIPALCDAKSSPRTLDSEIFAMDEEQTQFPYAYHFDTVLLAKFLTGYGTERGVNHILDQVTHVALDERGWISRIETEEHGALRGDLFIDCTGWRGLLINQALREPFESYQDTLPNDRAVALRVPVDAAERGLRPCTTATARNAGWIWTIPLFERLGTGYVYASDYISPDEAERELREFVGPEADGLEANHIRMRIGRTRNSWVRNCVAIGLSAGFVEPLESTGIFFIQNSIEQLVKHFPDSTWNEQLRRAYNSRIGRMMDGVREFLVLHYYGARRQDNQYWRDTKTRPLPDGLAERLEQWQVKLPDAESVFPYDHGFEPYSYQAMLLGLGGVPLRHPAVLDAIDDAPAMKFMQRTREEAGALADRLPSQYEYFSHLRGVAR